MRTVRVKAMEAYTRDVGRAIVRIDPKSILDLGLVDGDFLEVRGACITGAKCLPLYPTDWRTGIARMDALIRQNAGVPAGEQVEVSKAMPSPAKSIILTPLGEQSETTNTFIKQWQQREGPIESMYATELLSGMPIASGDFVMIDYRLSKMLLLVLEKEPQGGISVAGKNTKIDLLPWVTA